MNDLFVIASLAHKHGLLHAFRPGVERISNEGLQPYENDDLFAAGKLSEFLPFFC